MRRIGVLTSGGDAPGMNACIRAVVRAAEASDVEVYGIRRGYEGLLAAQLEPLDRSSIVNTIHRGGTILGTARCERMRTAEGCAEAVDVLHRHRIDGLVLIGGDGTFRGGASLEAAGGPPTVGVPGTIDNDVAGSDVSVGFDTAVNTALGAIDRIRDTATSHELLHFVEVMGRHHGALALAAGVAGGAETVLTPETPTSDDVLARKIGDAMALGKRSVIVVVAEGAREGGAAAVARAVGANLGLDYRVTVLGHVQRGGSPSASDRILGTVLGIDAVKALLEGASCTVIGQRGGQIVRTPYPASDAPGPVPDTKLTAVAALIS